MCSRLSQLRLSMGDFGVNLMLSNDTMTKLTKTIEEHKRKQPIDCDSTMLSFTLFFGRVSTLCNTDVSFKRKTLKTEV